MSTNAVKQAKQSEKTTGIVELSDSELAEVSGGFDGVYFRTLPGIEGGSTSSYGGGGGGGKVNVENLSITKY